MFRNLCETCQEIVDSGDGLVAIMEIAKIMQEKELQKDKDLAECKATIRAVWKITGARGKKNKAIYNLCESYFEDNNGRKK